MCDSLPTRHHLGYVATATPAGILGAAIFLLVHVPASCGCAKRKIESIVFDRNFTSTKVFSQLTPDHDLSGVFSYQEHYDDVFHSQGICQYQYFFSAGLPCPGPFPVFG